MNDMINEEAAEAVTEEITSKPKAKKPSQFMTALRENQVAQARDALMKTVCGNLEQTLGTIIEALEDDSEGEYLMLEIFKGLTVEELVSASIQRVSPPAALPPASAPAGEAEEEEEDEDDLEDDNEFEDDGSLENDDEPAPKSKSKKSKGNKKSKAKKASSKTTKKKSKAKGGGDSLVSKTYQKAILTLLKEQKARDPKSAISGENMRKGTEDFEGIGGESDELRANMESLREKGKIDKDGKARGMKYFRTKKKG